MRALAKSGFNGDETAGTCCSSSSPKGRLGATEEGVELRGRGDADIFSTLDILQRAGASVNFRKLDLLALALYFFNRTRLSCIELFASVTLKCPHQKERH